MRITDSMRYRQTLGDLGDIAERNSKLLQQAGTGRRLTKPSDNPTDAVRQLRLKTDISVQRDLVDRMAFATEEVRRTELAMDDSINIFQRARDLAIQATSSARTDTDFQAIATEADQLLHDMVAIGNRQVANRFLFGGTATTTQPFTLSGSPASTVTYNGDSGTRTVSPSPGLDITLNMPGDTAFQTTVDCFQALVDLRDAAAAQDVDRLGNAVSASLDTAFDHLVNLRTQTGAITSSLETTTQNLELQQLDLEALLADIEDADLTDTLVALKQTETQRTAALQAAARVTQATLLDFLA